MSMKQTELETLKELDKEATPGPWAYTENCGPQVTAGLIHDQGEGFVQLKKGGFFLLEIEPSVYDRDGDTDEDECDQQAFADVKFIATARLAVPRLVAEVERLRVHITDAKRCFERGLASHQFEKIEDAKRHLEAALEPGGES